MRLFDVISVLVKKLTAFIDLITTLNEAKARRSGLNLSVQLQCRAERYVLIFSNDVLLARVLAVM